MLSLFGACIKNQNNKFASKMEKTKLVVKDNALIDASFNLSLIEQRLMLLAIVQAREVSYLTSSTPIEITARQYSEQFSVHEKESYNALKKACDLLFDRRFSYIDKYKGNQLIKKVRWVSEIGYLENKGLVVLNLSDTVISLISRLEEQFTKYHLNQVSAFKSKYSIRLYETLMMWVNNGVTQKYKILDLREKLGVLVTEYKTMSLFKVNVLDKALLEINNKSDLTVKYEQFKEGRTITHIRFKMQSKAVESNDKKKQVRPLTDKQIDMFSDKLSQLHSFQNYYVADVGVSSEDYKIKIAEKLKDPFYVESWMQYLKEVGFNGGVMVSHS